MNRIGAIAMTADEQASFLARSRTILLSTRVASSDHSKLRGSV
jgi:hypothetical protein